MDAKWKKSVWTGNYYKDLGRNRRITRLHGGLGYIASCWVGNELLESPLLKTYKAGTNWLAKQTKES